MEILSLAEVGIEAAAERAAAVIDAGGVVLYPTDTLYGLGADALSEGAVARVYDIKARETAKPMHAIVADLNMAERYAEITDDIGLLARELPTGKVSFVAKKRPGFSTGIFHRRETFGFRIPDHAFCEALLAAFGGPITATSANLAGAESARSVPDILAQLGPLAAGIDLVIDGGALPARAPSSVVDVSLGRAVILREAAIPAAQIWEVLRAEY